MPASCYTVRPNAESGWLTFFELSPDRRCEGFFFVLGPLHVNPDSRRMAQGMARQIVTAYKGRLDPDPSAWLEEVGRILGGEGGQLEFGAMSLSGERLWTLQSGRVGLVPLTAAARHRVAPAERPSGTVEPRQVANGDRLFFGRLPREAAGRPAPGDVVRGVEQGGGGDGALIVTIHSLRGEAFRLPDDETGGGAAPRAVSSGGREAEGRTAVGKRAGRLRAGILLLLLLAGVAAVAWYVLPRP